MVVQVRNLDEGAELESVAHTAGPLMSLAEGADRIVAQAGLSAGFALSAILPFGRGVYCDDFKSEASRAEFSVRKR